MYVPNESLAVSHHEASAAVGQPPLRRAIVHALIGLASE